MDPDPPAPPTPEDLADELVRCRRRGLGRLDRQVASQQPLELPILKALSARRPDRRRRHDRGVSFGALIRATAAHLAQDRPDDARLVDELFFGDSTGRVPRTSPGELLDAARRRTGLSETAFRRQQREAFLRLAEIMLDNLGRDKELAVDRSGPGIAPDGVAVSTITSEHAAFDDPAASVPSLYAQPRDVAREHAGAERARQALRRYHRGDLTRPIAASGEARPEMRIPTLDEAYVSPDFRVGRIYVVGDLVDEDRWIGRPCRADLDEFLLEHLTGSDATRGPLIVLGQPGAGKSVLTRILAARLPHRDFLVVRAALREVPAEVDIQAQAEYALRATTGENLSWPELMHGRGDALAVLLLDGFDELLQATGARQTDYLERVAAFQQRQAALGHPVAVVVTTRIAVADYARYAPGTIALRIEPFRPAQVKRWLAIWNTANSEQLARRGLRELSPEIALATPELAYQPLLLLMLAIYDADDNALHRLDRKVDRAELYEQLLHRFVTREILKDARSLPSELDPAVKHELLQLSVVAFAMFNRGRQWVTEAELDDDMRILIARMPYQNGVGDGLRAELSPGQHALGRFFFVHEGVANRDGESLRAFEFLHATFGEYLVSRLIVHELSDAAQTISDSSGRSRPAIIDWALLQALVSHTPLTARINIVTFLCELISHPPLLEPYQRELLKEPVLKLFHQAMYPMETGRYAAYNPAHVAVTRRHASYTCNLVVLLTILGDGILGSELFPGGSDCTYRWRNLALLWRSQLPADGWQMLLEYLNLDRIRTDNIRDIRLSVTGQRQQKPSLDMFWSYQHALPSAQPDEDFTWTFHRPEDIRGNVYYLCDWRIDAAAHVGEPFATHLPEAITTFSHTSTGESHSAANALVNLWLSSGTNQPNDRLFAAYNICMTLAEKCAWKPASRISFIRLVARQLDIDRDRLAQDAQKEIRKRLHALGLPDK